MDIATSGSTLAATDKRRPSKNVPRLQKKPAEGRRRFSITLSPKAAEAFDWLKEFTDADTDSEVIRNALRLHYVLLQKAEAGDLFFTAPASQPDQLTKIQLFVSK